MNLISWQKSGFYMMYNITFKRNSINLLNKSDEVIYIERTLLSIFV